MIHTPIKLICNFYLQVDLLYAPFILTGRVTNSLSKKIYEPPTCETFKISNIENEKKCSLKENNLNSLICKQRWLYSLIIDGYSLEKLNTILNVYRIDVYKNITWTKNEQR